MLSTKNIVVEKHARVFTFGDLNSAEEIWLLFHGYAQNVDDFFKEFTPFKEGKTFVIPEGLSRFYQKGITGKTGASWMTSEERENEIKDQLNYLNTMFEEFNLKSKKLNIFAFSQGAMTASRWIEKNNIKTNRLIFWSGNTPEVIAKNPKSWIRTQNPEFYIGKNDQFAPHSIWSKFFRSSYSFTPTYHDGNHFFTSKELQEFIFTK